MAPSSSQGTVRSGDGETVEFAVDGTSYAIDLSAKNAKALRATLQTYTSAGRKTSATGTRRRRTQAVARPDRDQLQAIREWARAGGYEVAERGRISGAIVDAYNAS